MGRIVLGRNAGEEASMRSEISLCKEIEQRPAAAAAANAALK